MNLVRLALTWLAVLMIGLLLGRSETVERVDLQLYDSQLQLLRDSDHRPEGAPVALVGIDERTVESITPPMALWHAELGELILAMSQAGARIVGVDLILPDRSFNDFLQRDHDRSLLTGMLAARRAGMPVIFGRTVNESGQLLPMFPKFVAIMGQDGFGMVNQFQESDGVVRQFYHDRFQEVTGLHTLAGQMARKTDITDRSGWIDFSVGPDIGYTSLIDVLEWYRDGDSERLQRAFAGKAVFVGGVLPFVDRHFQPVVLANWENPPNPYAPGVLLHMQVYRALSADRMLDPVPAWVDALLLGLAAALVFLGNRPLLAAMVLLLYSAAVVAGSTALFVQGWRLGIAPVLMTALLGWLVRAALDAWSNIREKQRMRDAFGGYVSPQILKEIMAGSISPELGGESRRICLLFADICGFTTLSETNDAEHVLGLLNRYFDRVTPAIHEYGGTLDKYMGDGIMAFFGAPQEMDRPGHAAFQAACKMHEGLAELNRELVAEGHAPLQIGVGLGLGNAIVGHVGAQSRFEYSAIGDAVNVAARIEGLTRPLDCRIALTESVAEQLDETERRELIAFGMQQIKGHAPVEVYGWGLNDQSVSTPQTAVEAS